jgi:hypothetical protein
LITEFELIAEFILVISEYIQEFGNAGNLIANANLFFDLGNTFLKRQILGVNSILLEYGDD